MPPPGPFPLQVHLSVWPRPFIWPYASQKSAENFTDSFVFPLVLSGGVGQNLHPVDGSHDPSALTPEPHIVRHPQPGWLRWWPGGWSLVVPASQRVNLLNHENHNLFFVLILHLFFPSSFPSTTAIPFPLLLPSPSSSFTLFLPSPFACTTFPSSVSVLSYLRFPSHILF